MTATVTPLLTHTRVELDDALAAARRSGTPVVLVPTMGALHEGHASLIRAARARAGDGRVVVSVFVNPMQFAAGEDLDRYPRTLDADVEICAREGADVVFVPDVAEVYPRGVPSESELVDAVTVDPGGLAGVLEGKSRPGHFRGVLTVVAKLLGLVQPDAAVFGQKDYQQLVLIRRMVADLCLPVEIVGVETVREHDGLAMSSRNRYLSEQQRRAAASLHRTLLAAQRAATHGVTAALRAARTELRTASMVDLDYLTVTSPELAALPADEEIEPGTTARVLIAGRVGATRLIDNVPAVLGAPAEGPTARVAAGTDTTRGDS